MTGQEFTRQNEGYRSDIYLDSLRKPTVGFGTYLYPGRRFPRDVCERLFDEDYADAAKAFETDYGDMGLDEVRRIALIDMIYQLGRQGVKNFRHTINHLRMCDWQGAHDGILDSLYAKQTPERAKRVAQMFLTGQFPTS